MGTNLHYELPESKVKAASKQDWKVDNDNAEMLAMNSPVLATVDVKHPKFSMMGQWPGYKTSFKVPKDVSVASKRTDFSKTFPVKHQKFENKAGQHDADISGSTRVSGGQAKANSQTEGSGFFLSKMTEKFFKRKTPGTKSRHEDSGEILSISKLLLPIAGIKNIDLKNPHVNKAMKGVIKNARKVVDEAKTVLNDAANFITGVRKLVTVTKDETKMKRKEAKANVVAKETEKVGAEGFAIQSSKHSASTSEERDEEERGRLKVGKGAKIHDLKGRQTLQTNPNDQTHDRKAKQGNEGKEISRKRDGSSTKGVSKRSYIDSLETEKAHEQFEGTKATVKKRGLPETLESILSTISGLKHLLRYR